MAGGIKIGITGLPGSGRTELLLTIVDMLQAEKVKVGGVITEPIIEEGKVTGFKMVDFITKEEAIIASTGLNSKARFNEFGIDLDTLGLFSVNAIKRAVYQSDLVVIDEIGRIQMKSEYFNKAVLNALKSSKPILMTIYRKSRSSLLQDIRRRDDIRMLEVTPVNRGILPFKIFKVFKEGM